MDHAEAQRLISDWARGRLDAARAREVEAHARGCADCTSAAEAAAGLEAESRRLAAEAAPHPAPEALARYVEAPEESSTLELARIAAHVRACGRCREDLEIARASAAPAWWRAVRAWLAAPAGPLRALQPALALAALLLVYPAWIGLVESPREIAAANRRAREADARARAGAVAAPAPRGGGIAVLVLRGATRGSDDLPELRPRPGQVLQPVLVDANMPGTTVAVTLVREPGTRVWQAEGPREQFWDPANALFGMLVPAAALAPGEYRLELAPAAGAAPQVTARFRVPAPVADPSGPASPASR